MRVLGIDPGSGVTGFGVVERCGARVEHVAHGTVRLPRGELLPARLAALHAGIAEAIRVHRPEVVAVERVFAGRSPRSALVLGHARGVALAAASAAGLAVFEYAPSEIKNAVVGTGRADKQQVQAMVARLLALEAPPPQDAADALAAALCHAHRGRLTALPGWGAPRTRRRASPRAARLVWRREP